MMREVVVKYLSWVHTFLFACFVPLAVYAQNRAEVAVGDIIVPIAIVLAVSAVVQLIFWLLRVDTNRANIVVSATWLAFFLLMPVTQSSGLRIRYVVLGFLVLGAAVVVVAVRASRASIARATQVMALAAVLFTLNPLSVVAAETWSSWRDDRDATQQGNALETQQAASGLPDIYYVILDGYTSQRALRKFFDYDNSEFEDYLRAKGFFIAESSHSNYPSTINSLATTLNMSYATTWKLDDPVRIRRTIHNSRAFQILKKRGYRIAFVTMSGHLRPDEPAPLIDDQIAFGGISGLPQYQMTLLGMTPLRLILVVADRLSLRFGGRFDRDGKLWAPEGIDWALDKMSEGNKSSEPAFTFVHVLSPHSPFYHDANCNVVREYSRTSWDNFNRDFAEYRRAYVAQVQCLNRKVMKALDTLLSGEGDRMRVVIIQADHGAPEIMNTSIQRHDPRVNLAEFRFSILNAYRVPDSVKRRLYDGITPVNSFRVLLSEMFQQDLATLPDKSYWVGPGRHDEAEWPK